MMTDEPAQLPEKQQRAEVQFHQLIEQAAEGIFILDQDGQFILANSRICEMLGYSQQELLQTNILDTYPLELRSAGQQRLAALRIGQHLRFERPIQRKDGSTFWIEASASAGVDGSLQSFIHDITERKQTEAALRESEEKYRRLFEMVSDALFLIDNETGRILDANFAATILYGYSRDELLQIRNVDLSYEPDETKVATILGIEKIPLRYHRKKDGSVFPVEISATHITWKGRPAHIPAIRDITERKRMMEAEREQRVLAEALRDTAAALNNTLKVDDVLDRILENVGRVVAYDAVYIILLDATRQIGQVVRQRDAQHLNHAVEMQGFKFVVSQTRNLREIQTTGAPLIIGDTRRYEGWISTPSSAWEHAYLGAPVIIKGEIIGFLSLASARPDAFTPLEADRLRAFANQAAIAIENARLYAEVLELAITDPLTGVSNRRGLFQVGEREVVRGLRFQRPLAVVMLDIDNFKRVNDTYGHPIGDRVLQALAVCCRAHVRNVDVVARYGGEEFILLLPEIDLECAVQVAERLRQAVEKMVVPAETDEGRVGTTVQVTVSQGVAMLAPDTPDLMDLLVRADRAMYAAKQAGRNCIMVE
jgi:diguanylate cyclase (GGDEF)-like protein/PAS domain S-box-containing protein